MSWKEFGSESRPSPYESFGLGRQPTHSRQGRWSFGA
jgi:hypothetical protein